MQNGSLDELDEDLLSELNSVVRDNQLAYLPFARSGRAEALLFDKYPELAERIERGKRAKIDAIVLSNKYAEGDGTVSTSFRAQSLEEISSSPLRQRTRRRPSKGIKENDESPTMTPALKPRTSAQDLMFEMSDGEDDLDEVGKIQQPRFTDSTTQEQAIATPIGSPEEPWAVVSKQRRPSSHRAINENAKSPPSDVAPSSATKESKQPGRPWGPAPLVASKLDLKNIMAQASVDKPSNLTLGLSREGSEDKPSGSFHSKMSQKERKRQQQVQGLNQPTAIEKPQPAPPTVSPWQAMSHRKPNPASTPLASSSPQPSRTPSTPHLTMRQTIANNGVASKQKTQQAGQGTSSMSGTQQKEQNRLSLQSERGMSADTSPVPAPHSIRHIPLPRHSPTSPSQNLSITEILSLQQAEKDYVKDAASKRSLQEIQQEQQFQQW
jgi:inhibitor of Bruton tyrosine kinase